MYNSPVCIYVAQKTDDKHTCTPHKYHTGDTSTKRKQQQKPQQQQQALAKLSTILFLHLARRATNTSRDTPVERMTALLNIDYARLSEMAVRQNHPEITEHSPSKTPKKSWEQPTGSPCSLFQQTPTLAYRSNTVTTPFHEQTVTAHVSHKAARRRCTLATNGLVFVR